MSFACLDFFYIWQIKARVWQIGISFPRENLETKAQRTQAVRNYRQLVASKRSSAMPTKLVCVRVRVVGCAGEGVGELKLGNNRENGEPLYRCFFFTYVIRRSIGVRV